MKRVLITGFSGFIGFHLVKQLKHKFKVCALDNFSQATNYDIKILRAKELGIESPAALHFNPVQVNDVGYYYADICDTAAIEKIFDVTAIDIIIHLAALTGIRPSLVNPQAYIDTNVKGFVNVMECARKYGVQKVVYASSSSVYGASTESVYTETQRTDSPISVYAATKKADELLAYTYASLYGINITGLRFFTAYGPWTRRDMASYIFMKSVHEQRPVDLFYEGKMMRDFTYVDDIVRAVSLVVDGMDNGYIKGYNLYNVGNDNPIPVIAYLNAIEDAMGRKALVNYKPMQSGEMECTCASSDALYNATGFKPEVDLKTGVAEMVRWFSEFNTRIVL
jgi:UDP-glucuronate 4-epimerase